MVPAFVFSAIAYGTFIALMAMGLTLTYMTTKVPNFAYGSFVTIGLYTSYQLSTLNHLNPYLASPVAFVVTGLVSVIMYVGVLRPLARRGTPLIGLMIATFGVDVGFVGIIGIYTDYLATSYHLGTEVKQFYYLPGDFSINLFGQAVQGVVIAGPAILAGITLGIFILFTRTRFGVAMRASVENASLAKVLGINVERVNLVSWMLAGGFAGLAGAMYTLALPGGTDTGSNLIVEIFAASILGGLTSIFGAVLGGLVIGGSEDIVTNLLSQGFGYVGGGAIALLSLLVGGYLVRRRKRSSLVSGGILVSVGIYILLEMATGFSTDFFVNGLVNGYQTLAIQFEKGVPLIIMIAALMVLPKGLVSINLRRRKKEAK